MKDYNKNKESSYIQYFDVKNLYGCAMSKKLPADNFECIKDICQFNEEFINEQRVYVMKKFMKDIFLKLMFNMLKNYMNFLMIYDFHWKQWKWKKLKKLQLFKTEYVIHIINLKQAEYLGLVLKKVHRVIKFN